LCLAVPAEIISLGPPARVRIEGNVRECFLDLVPDARIGDYVLLHAGMAIQVLDPEEAEETLELLEEAYGDLYPEDPRCNPEGLSRPEAGPENAGGPETAT